MATKATTISHRSSTERRWTAGEDRARHAPADRRERRALETGPCVLAPPERRIGEKRGAEPEMPEDEQPRSRLPVGSQEPGRRKRAGERQGMRDDDERREQVGE